MEDRPTDRSGFAAKLVGLVAVLVVVAAAAVWVIASNRSDSDSGDPSPVGSLVRADTDGCRQRGLAVVEYLRTGNDGGDLELLVFGEDRARILTLPSGQKNDAIRKTANKAIRVCECDEGNNPKWCDQLS